MLALTGYFDGGFSGSDVDWFISYFCFAISVILFCIRLFRSLEKWSVSRCSDLFIRCGSNHSILQQIWNGISQSILGIPVFCCMTLCLMLSERDDNRKRHHICDFIDIVEHCIRVTVSRSIYPVFS